VSVPADEPLGRAGVERLADPALALVGGPVAGVEAVVLRRRAGLARFANSQIHQHVETDTIAVHLRVVTDDGRVGVAAATTDDPAEVAVAAATAARLARVCPPDPDFPGFAPAAEVGQVPVDRAVLDASAALRASGVAAVVAAVPRGFEAAGAYATGGDELGVCTSAGQRVYTVRSSTTLTVVVSGPSSAGYAEAGGRHLDDVDPARVGERAAGKARAGADPVEVLPGAWLVVLEPAASGALVQFLAFVGFGGRELLEGRSFLAHRLGEQVVDPRITIVDDGGSTETLGLPVDYEGTPKQRVELIRGGVAHAAVHDRYTARRAGVASTGHALPAPNPHGPVATDPLLLPGDGGALEDLVAGVERGLLVTRFHYTNVVNAVHTTITGMTRDGTFLVEDGRVTRAVRNLRFTQSILEALSGVEAVSSETAYASELFFGGARCPGLRLPAFTFTSTTSFG
jgi:predicted Zn-dependent protease